MVAETNQEERNAADLTAMKPTSAAKYTKSGYICTTLGESGRTPVDFANGHFIG